MAKITIAGNGNIVVSGELGFATVPQLNSLGSDLIKKNLRAVFDFSNVSACDNAAVALLIAWARLAKQHNREIVYTNLPKQLHDLVIACGLKDILPILK